MQEQESSNIRSPTPRSNSGNNIYYYVTTWDPKRSRVATPPTRVEKLLMPFAIKILTNVAKKTVTKIII